MLIRKHRRLPRPAFTLMEMMIVVAIIVALAGIGILYLNGLGEEGNKTKVRADIKNLTTAVGIYKSHHASMWPQSLEALLVRDEYGGPYIKGGENLRDPWGRMYNYDPSGPNNLGANGVAEPDIWCDMPNNLGKACNWTSKIIPN